MHCVDSKAMQVTMKGGYEMLKSGLHMRPRDEANDCLSVIRTIFGLHSLCNTVQISIYGLKTIFNNSFDNICRFRCQSEHNLLIKAPFSPNNYTVSVPHIKVYVCTG